MKKMQKMLSIACIGMLLATALTGCGGDKKGSGDTIKIGANIEMTGGSASFGKSAQNGIKLAIDAENAKGGVLGKKLELVVADNKSEAAEATNAMQKLVAQDKVVAVIGPNLSSASIAATSVNTGAKVLAISPMGTNPNVTVDKDGKTKDFMFRACFIDPFQGTVMANYAFKKGAKKVAIVQEVSNDYAVGLAKFFKDAFEKLGGQVIDVANYQTGDKDFTAVLTNIKAKNPDAIFAPGNFTESALLIKQARQLGIKAPFMGGDTWETQEFIDVGGKDVEGIAFSSAFDREKATTAEAKKFMEEYVKEYKGEPSAFNALGYDAYMIAYDAMKRGGTDDSTKIRDAIAATKGLELVTGKTEFDKNGDPLKGAVIKTVKDSKFKYIDFVDVKR